MSSSDNGIKLNDSSSRLWRPRGLSSLVVSSAFRLVAIMIQYDYRQVPKLYYFPPPILSFHAKGITQQLHCVHCTGVLSMRNTSNTRRQIRVHQASRAEGAHFLPPLCGAMMAPWNKLSHFSFFLARESPKKSCLRLHTVPGRATVARIQLTHYIFII